MTGNGPLVWQEDGFWTLDRTNKSGLIAIYQTEEPSPCLQQLTIDEVFNFPKQTSYRGGYDARGNIQISAGGYKVDTHSHYFTTGELKKFKESLSLCYKDFCGISTLDSAEREFELTISFTRWGKVRITGWFQERPDINNRLIFDFESDQTCILEVIQQLNLVQKIFGDMKGIS